MIADFGRSPVQQACWVGRRGSFGIVLCSMVACLTPTSGAKSRNLRVNLFPRIHAGQTLVYQVTYHSDTLIKTQSKIIVATPDNSATVDVSAVLRLQVLEARAQGDRATIQVRATIEMIDPDPRRVPDGESSAPPGSDHKLGVVEFTVLPNGILDRVTGLEALLPDQLQAWQEWSARFLLALASPNTVVPSQKWTSVEAEKSASPIAGLRWVRASTYVGNESCHSVSLAAPAGAASEDPEPDTCAVILTNATLRQNSKPKDTTPDDFKLHQLRTSGSAGGANRIITFVSLRTGLLVRATEEASQRMDATIAKADGSNRVHYDVQAKSRSEVVMISDPSPRKPQ